MDILHLTFTRLTDFVYVQEEYLRLEDCLSHIDTVMSPNKLKMNSNKTQIMLFYANRQRLQSFNITSFSIAGTQVPVTDGPITNLGVIFDSSLSNILKILLNSLFGHWDPHILTTVITYYYGLASDLLLRV